MLSQISGMGRSSPRTYPRSHILHRCGIASLSLTLSHSVSLYCSRSLSLSPTITITITVTSTIISTIPHVVQVGRLDVPIEQVRCGWDFTLAIGQEGHVYCWGSGSAGQCGTGEAKNELTPRRVRGLDLPDSDNPTSPVRDAACGYSHSLLLLRDGTLYSWGYGESGQLGRDIALSSIPAKVPLEDVLEPGDSLVSVAAGAFHSICGTARRRIYVWGMNSSGNLGLGDTVDRLSPTACPLLVPKTCECDDPFDGDDAGGGDIGGDIDGDGGQRKATRVYGDVRFAAGMCGSFAYCATDLSAKGQGDVDRHVVPGHAAPSLAHGTVAAQAQREKAILAATRRWQQQILPRWQQLRHAPWVHELWRQGIPPSLRREVWTLAIGNGLKCTPEQYFVLAGRARATASMEQPLGRSEGQGGQGGQGASEESTNSAARRGRNHSSSNGGEGREGREGKDVESQKLIDVDLPRTFPALKFFAGKGAYNEALREVLEVFAYSRPDLGYIQGMSFLAAMLLLHMSDPYLVYQCLFNLVIKSHLFAFYRLEQGLLSRYYTVFDRSLQTRLPDLHRCFKYHEVPPETYLYPWLQTIFLRYDNR